MGVGSMGLNAWTCFSHIFNAALCVLDNQVLQCGRLSQGYLHHFEQILPDFQI